jgi:transcription-repair coupling factor (superfamily II helicase)
MPAVRTMLVPVPRTAAAGAQPLRDTELLAWCGEVIRSVLADQLEGESESIKPARAG